MLRVIMAEEEARDPEAALAMTLARLFPDQERRRLVLDLIKTVRALESNNATDNGGDLAPPVSSPLRQHGAETTKRRQNAQGPRHPKSSEPLILLYAASSA